MPALLRRYRWWLAPSGLVVLVLLARLLYTATLSGEAWLTQGWYALRAHDYTRAEACFRQAARKMPHSGVPRIAQFAGDQLEQSGVPHAPFLQRFARVPGVGARLAAVEQRHFAQRRRRLASRLPRETAWGQATYGAMWGELAGLYRDFWIVYPREYLLAAGAVQAAYQGQYARAWDDFHTLQTRYPPANASFAPYLTPTYVQVAWRTGRIDVAEKAIQEALAAPLPKRTRPGALEPALRHNLQLSRAGIAKPATVWAISRGALWERSWMPKAGGVGAARLLLVPGRAQAYLFQVPVFTPGTPVDDTQVHWWAWDGIRWQARAPEDATVLTRLLRSTTTAPGTIEAACSSTWSASAEYLAFQGTLYDGFASVLVRTDQGITQVGGHTPREIVLAGGDLWVHEAHGYTRIAPGGQMTEFDGTAITRLGNMTDPFCGPAPETAATFSLDDRWRLARDGTDRLWLVSEAGPALTVQAVWERGGFRPATAVEQAAASGGLVDAAGRLWWTKELPAGFRRDAWRRVPGLPAVTVPAAYAVDGKGRVWVIGGGVAARWETGGWLSVANRLPLSFAYRAIAPAGNGVMILLPAQVCYLE